MSRQLKAQRRIPAAQYARIDQAVHAHLKTEQLYWK